MPKAKNLQWPHKPVGRALHADRRVWESQGFSLGPRCAQLHCSARPPVHSCSTAVLLSAAGCTPQRAVRDAVSAGSMASHTPGPVQPPRSHCISPSATALKRRTPCSSRLFSHWRSLAMFTPIRCQRLPASANILKPLASLKKANQASKQGGPHAHPTEATCGHSGPLHTPLCYSQNALLSPFSSSTLCSPPESIAPASIPAAEGKRKRHSRAFFCCRSI